MTDVFKYHLMTEESFLHPEFPAVSYCGVTLGSMDWNWFSLRDHVTERFPGLTMHPRSPCSECLEKVPPLDWLRIADL